jgi:hypothetical protein
MNLKREIFYNASNGNYTMKLFANGCSFTRGHKDWGENDASTPWAWPGAIAPHFDDTVNFGWSGGSNERILRTTMDFFDSVIDNSEWIAVIQWTDCYSRHEMYDEATDTYFGYISSNPTDPVLDFSTNRKFVTIPEHIKRTIEFYHKISFTRSKQSMQVRLLEQQFILSEYFKKNNINFLFTGMSHSSTVDKTLIHPLMRYLPNENIVLPFSHLINDHVHLRESETDFHPNKAGHQLLANYIINELKARNYL